MLASKVLEAYDSVDLAINAGSIKVVGSCFFGELLMLAFAEIKRGKGRLLQEEMRAC